MNTIAVLLTCHNRCTTTISCLQNLFSGQLLSNQKLDVFLVDDGSTDGTSDAVKEQFPIVNIIQGNGNLFWNQGMRLAWETASKAKDYDFYFWLNDDTILNYDTIFKLLEAYQEILENDNKPAIICGACKSSVEGNIFSYGGRTDSGPVLPNGLLQECKYINGNAVLIPNEVFRLIGNLSPNYTHIWGDVDYGLRAREEKFKCYTTKTYIAICPKDKGLPAWCNPKTSLRKRWELFHSPKGLNISEYIIYRKKFWGPEWIVFAIKAYIKVFLPALYGTISP